MNKNKMTFNSKSSEFFKWLDLILNKYEFCIDIIV